MILSKNFFLLKFIIKQFENKYDFFLRFLQNIFLIKLFNVCNASLIFKSFLIVKKYFMTTVKGTNILKEIILEENIWLYFCFHIFNDALICLSFPQFFSPNLWVFLLQILFKNIFVYNLKEWFDLIKLLITFFRLIIPLFV